MASYIQPESHFYHMLVSPFIVLITQRVTGSLVIDKKISFHLFNSDQNQLSTVLFVSKKLENEYYFHK